MTTSRPAPTPMIEFDARSRLTLPGKAHNRYLVHEQEDGTVILEPAVVLSALEARYRDNAELQATVEAGRAHPELRSPRPERRTA